MTSKKRRSINSGQVSDIFGASMAQQDLAILALEVEDLQAQLIVSNEALRKSLAYGKAVRDEMQILRDRMKHADKILARRDRTISKLKVGS